MDLPIFLDYMSTTPIDPAVAKAMQVCLCHSGPFGNPASTSHRYGWDASECVEHARANVAKLIGAAANEIVFTSGATESDNLAIKGAAFAYQRKGRHIVTMETEHKAVLDTCIYLERQGFEVTWLKPDATGYLDPAIFEAALRPDTILASVMWVNNETGMIQDIPTLSAMTRARGILFHSDCAQAAGKVPIDVNTVPVDLLSFSGHKIYGPKGIGALYVRRTPRVRLSAQMHGGGHEFGMRSGTLATHQIVGLGEAFNIAGERMALDAAHHVQLRDQLWQGLTELGGVVLHGDFARQVPHCLNISIDGTKADSIFIALRDLAVSSGSACSSSNPQPSHVLRSMGVSPEEANRSIRISFGRFTTQAEIAFAVETIQTQVKRLRSGLNTHRIASS